MVAGRTTEPRSVTITTTITSTAITAPAGTFTEEDAGRRIAAAGVPAGATLTSVTSDTAATLSAAATAAGTVAATIGVAGETVAPTAYGFIGWSPESDAESETYSIAGGASASSPDRLTNATTPATGSTRRTRG